MKNIFGFIKPTKEVKEGSFELLSENEMFSLRGGTEPIRPKSQPRDIYDDELE